VLDEGSRRISDLKDDPEVRARLLSQMGAAYQNLGYYAQAVEHFENALRIRRELSNGDGADIPLLLVNLAEAQRGMGNFPVSEKLLSEALAGVKAHKIGPSIEHADLLRAIGRLEHTRGDLDSAERNYKESVRMLRSLGETASPQLGRSLSALAALYSWKNDLPAAERNGREALAILQNTVPARHPDRIFAQLALGDVLFQEKHLDEAGSLIEDVVLAQRSLYGNAGPQLAQSLTFLAWVREAQGRPAETEAHLNEALGCVQRSLGIEHYEVGYAHTSIARFLVHAHRYDEANANARRALVILANALPDDHQYVASAQYWLGESLLGSHRYVEAVEVLRKALATWKAAHATPWLASRTESALGAALIGAGERAEGERMVRESYYTLLKERGADDEATNAALRRFKDSSKSAAQTGPVQK
jgi:tetratricopeptide (TPR) repeat protein